VARPRIPSIPAATRLREIVDLIDGATAGAANPTTLIAIAHNKAALLASDHGLSQLARELCCRHHDRYTSLRPWTAPLARLALEPLINLARLDIRDGHADDAVALLTALWRGVEAGDDAVIRGRAVRVDDLDRGSKDWKDLRLWLWTLVLSEGIRALSAAGRWSDALAHAQRHSGIGRRLLDGRQVAVLAHVAAGDHSIAERLIAESDVREPWEHAVAAALAAIDRGAVATYAERTATMVARYLDIDLDLSYTAFVDLLGLAVVDLAGGTTRLTGPEQPVAFVTLRWRPTTDGSPPRSSATTCNAP